MSAAARIALCLPGGGATGAMFQIGALAALEDALRDATEAAGQDVPAGAIGMLLDFGVLRGG